ncbi:MAG: response regulator [Candidatus Pacebacteria bacterium]|nr:response regulator [Candidatus Paceibacterota bacterium]
MDTPTETNKQKKKILIVDDDKFLLDMYSVKFEKNDFEVQTGLGGAEALAKLENGFIPDVVLFDIAMPSMDGPEFLGMVREKAYAPQAIFIALSNQNEQEQMEKVKSLGAVEYLIKATMTPQELMEKVFQIEAEHRPA